MGETAHAVGRQIVMRTESTNLLSHPAGTNMFVAHSSPYEPFALDTVRIVGARNSFKGNSGESIDFAIPKFGNYLTDLTVGFVAPAIVNQATVAVTRHGANEGISSVAYTDAADSAIAGTVTLTVVDGDAGLLGSLFNPVVTNNSDAASTAAYLSGGGVNNPGYGHSSPAVTVGNADSTATPYVTSAPLGGGTHERYRYIIPSGVTGPDNSVLISSDNPTTLYVGDMIIIESFVNQTFGVVTKTNSLLSGGVYPTNSGSSYYQQLGASVNDVACHYCDYAPIALIDEAILKIGTHEVTVRMMDILLYHELYIPTSDRMQGGYLNQSDNAQQLKYWAMDQCMWFVRLPFFFTGELGSAFAISALTSQDVVLRLKFNSWHSIIVNGTGSSLFPTSILTSAVAARTVAVSNTETRSETHTSSTAPSFLSSTTAPTVGTLVAATDFSYYLYATYGHVLNQSVNKDLKTTRPMLVHQQVGVKSIAPGAGLESLELQFNYDVAAINWTGRLKSDLVQNKQLNLEGLHNPITACVGNREGRNTRSIFQQCQLIVDNKPRTSVKTGHMYRDLAQTRSCESTTKKEIYTLAFCAGNPYALQKSGNMEFTTIPKAQLQVKVDPAIFADNSAVLGINGTKTGNITGGNTVDWQCNSVGYTQYSIEDGQFSIDFSS